VRARKERIEEQAGQEVARNHGLVDGKLWSDGKACLRLRKKEKEKERIDCGVS
jgi:hypothetical protein